jgi:hypothetical protein
MGFLSDLKGTLNTFFQIEKNGVLLKNNSGNLIIRNSDDSADTNLTIAKLNLSSGEVSISNQTVHLVASNLSQGRLTLTSNTPVLSSNVTGAINIFYTPYIGNQISLYINNTWEVKTFSELTLSLSGLTTDTLYDVFIFDNNGVLTLQAVAWADSTAGASARNSSLIYLNGVRVKSSDNRKYLGTFRTSATGQTEFSFQRNNDSSPCKLFLINEFNKIKFDAWKGVVPSHTYTTSSWRSVNNNTSFQIQFLAEGNMFIQLQGLIRAMVFGIGLNSTSTPYRQTLHNDLAGSYTNASTIYNPNLFGYNFLQILEYGLNTNGAYRTGYAQPELTMIYEA